MMCIKNKTVFVILLILMAPLFGAQKEKYSESDYYIKMPVVEEIINQGDFIEDANLERPEMVFRFIIHTPQDRLGLRVNHEKGVLCWRLRDPLNVKNIVLSLEKNIIAACWLRRSGILPFSAAYAMADMRSEVVSPCMNCLKHKYEALCMGPECTQDQIAIRDILQEKVASIASLPGQQIKVLALYANRNDIRGRHDLLPEINEYLRACDGSINHIRVPRSFFELQIPVLACS